MGRLDWGLRRRIESSGIPNHKIDELVEHLQSNFPDYRRMKNFNKRVESILKTCTQKPKKFNFDEDDDNTDGTNSVTITPSRSPARKKHKKLDASEQRLQRKEAQHIITRRRRRKKEFDNRHSTMASSGSTSSSSSEEDVTPEFDFTKSMLRSSYAKNVAAAAAKVEEERNMEVEVDSKAKKANSSSVGGGVGKGEEVRKSGPRFKDIGGIKGVLEKLIDEVIVPLKNPELPRWLGVKPITGILLKGPPGCGKTKLAHAIANETGVPFYKISATEVVSGVSGASEENIRDLFSKAYRTAPSIVFIDEIDAIASKRESLQREMERRIVTQLMTCMDESHQSIVIPDTESNLGTSDKKPAYVLVIGATNRPDALDPALRRPGRFDQEIDLGVPDEKARVEILKVLTANLRLDGAFDLDKIARFTPGFVGADLAALANKAGNLAMKRIINRRRAEISGEPTIEESNEDWWMRPWTPEEMEKLSITMSDFEDASKIVQPSSRREGFSAIPNVKWEDVGGLDFLRKEFERYIVRRIKHPEDYEFFGADMGTGFLLYGPPGCGKTLIAKAVANESGANFIHIKGPEILNKYVGESEMAIRTIFSRARTCAPCILFFDEVDALTTQRGLEGGHVVERLLNQLLIELDGAGERRGVYVIGATNRLEVMDRAVLRPGRFGKLLHVPLPGPDQRGLILRALARDKPIDKNVDLFSIGRTDSCEKLSGADLAAVMNEAAMAAMEEKHMLDPGNHDTRSWTIKGEHFEQALKKVSPSVSDEQIKYYKGISRTFKTA